MDVLLAASTKVEVEAPNTAAEALALAKLVTDGRMVDGGTGSHPGQTMSAMARSDSTISLRRRKLMPVMMMRSAVK